jgi:Spy/CpxP family protein refolding chaperone
MHRSRPWLALTLAAALALPTVAAHSAAPGPDPDAIRARMQEAAQRLQLSDAQKEQLKPIVEDHVAKVRAVRDKYPPETSRQDKRAMLEEMRGVREDYDTRIRAILTPEQQKEWDQMRADARGRMREHWRERRAAQDGAGAR